MATNFHTGTLNQLDAVLGGPGGLLMEGITTLQGRGDSHLNALVNDLVALRRELAGTADKARVAALVKRIYQQAGQVRGHDADVTAVAQQLRDSIMSAVRR